MSGTKVFIDTNICIYLLNGDNDLAELLEDQLIYISVITEMELYSAKSMTDEELEVLNDFIKSVTVVELNALVKQKTIELRKADKLKLPDSIIAASALVTDYPFISADKAFEKIKALDLILYKKQ